MATHYAILKTGIVASKIFISQQYLNLEPLI